MNGQPKLFLIGGPNGAGKSTFAHEFLAENPDFIFLNADEIARNIQSENVRDARITAGRTFLTRLAELRMTQANLVVESTLSGISLAQQVRQFIAAGYYITLVYVIFTNLAIIFQPGSRTGSGRRSRHSHRGHRAPVCPK